MSVSEYKFGCICLDELVPPDFGDGLPCNFRSPMNPGKSLTFNLCVCVCFIVNMGVTMSVFFTCQNLCYNELYLFSVFSVKFRGTIRFTYGKHLYWTLWHVL